MSAGWGYQPQSQDDEQYTAPGDTPGSYLSPFNFPFHFQLAHDYPDTTQHQQSPWAPSHPQVHYDDDDDAAMTGPSTRPAPSYHDQSTWTPQLPQYWEDGGYPAVLGGGHQAAYHHSPQPSHDDAAIAVPTEHHPNSYEHFPQDQAVHPIPHHLSDLGLPSLVDAWQRQTSTIPAVNAAASHAMSNPSSSDDSGSMSAMPSTTQLHNTFDDIGHHSVILASSSCPVRAPQDSSGSNRSSRRNSKLITTKTTATKRSTTSIGLRVIPYRREDILNQCSEMIKKTAFGESLLPSPESMSNWVYSTWSTVANLQTDGTLHHWALDILKNNERYRISKLKPALTGVLNEMKAAMRPLVCYTYDLAFDFTKTLDNSYVNERATRVQRLVENDRFLYSQLSIGGVDVDVAFANPAMLSIVSYFLRDSEHQYQRYIEDLNIKPLLAITATFCRWALQERDTGRFISSMFLPEVNRTQHDRYVLLLEALSQPTLDALTSRLLAII
ncbi:hypothetical protein C8R48DRAFT_767028 [Suillus tomentosus]|nr:hypothetical protein C8R48DRAFT_767028 [Suillus tomentosus]